MAGEVVAEDLFGVLGESGGEVVEGFVVRRFVEVFFCGGVGSVWVVEVCYAGGGRGGVVCGNWFEVFGFCVEVEVGKRGWEEGRGGPGVLWLWVVLFLALVLVLVFWRGGRDPQFVGEGLDWWLGRFCCEV